MIRIGPKTRLHGMRQELLFANMVLLAILIKHNVVMILSHGIDGVHGWASIHYAGGAEDLTFSGRYDIIIRHQVYNEWKSAVGQDFDIVFEDPGGVNEHIHCEWQPKEPYK